MPYGPRLQERFGYTPVYLRYNSGLQVSDNGHDLTWLLDRLTAAWPEGVEDLLLVGHSTGGLVVRSACHYGSRAAAPWTERARHVFYLGRRIRGLRSPAPAGLAGVAGCDQDGCLRDHRGEVPLLSGAGHYAISATIAADPGSRAGPVVGDLPVRPASGYGRRGRQRVPFPGRPSFDGMHHFDLLNHPAVWATMRDTLAGR